MSFLKIITVITSLLLVLSTLQYGAATTPSAPTADDGAFAYRIRIEIDLPDAFLRDLETGDAPAASRVLEDNIAVHCFVQLAAHRPAAAEQASQYLKQAATRESCSLLPHAVKEPLLIHFLYAGAVPLSVLLIADVVFQAAEDLNATDGASNTTTAQQVYEKAFAQLRPTDQPLSRALLRQLK